MLKKFKAEFFPQHGQRSVEFSLEVIQLKNEINFCLCTTIEYVCTFSIYNMHSYLNQDSMALVFEVFNNLFFKFMLICVIHFIFLDTVESEKCLAINIDCSSP